ncbi:MAG TPA: hypothetical protein VEH02_10810 [Pseudolabrys sp.]|nr:hypothetical protein [Pseudolabrys sp.]
MKVFSVATAAACLFVSLLTQPTSAQEFDPRCNDIFDKVACTCAVRNGGRIIRPPVGMKRQGLKLQPKEAPQAMRTLDGGRVAFPKYYQREGFKIHRSRALEGYLACMRAAGRR